MNRSSQIAISIFALPILGNSSTIVIGARGVVATDIRKGTIFISYDGWGDECTQSKPCGVKKGIKKAKAGDIVFFKGGLYDISTLDKFPKKRIKLNGGLKGKPIIYESYPNELAIFDGKNLKKGDFGSILLRNYTHLRRVEVLNMQKVGIKIRGNHNLVEGVESHHNRSTGIHIFGRYKVDDSSASYNIIKDCKLHHNSDINTKFQGDNADGISVSNGMHNLITHNSVYSNSDDGVDTWRSIDTTIEYSISYDNGKGEKGNGMGFKLGGDNNKSSLLGTGAISRFNIAYSNRNSGYSENAGKNITIKNSISYNNGGYGFVALLKNNSSIIDNISYKNREGDLYTTKTLVKNNSWQIKESIDDSDFLSLQNSSKGFLKPQNNSKLFKIGAYAYIEPTSTK